MTEDQQMKTDMRNLDRWAKALDRHYGHETVMQMFLYVGVGHALDHGFSPGGIAGAFRLLAEQVEQAHGAWSLKDIIRLAKDAHDKHLELDAGRRIHGPRARKDTSKKKMMVLEKHVKSIREKHPLWTVDAVADHIIENKLSVYSEETTRKHVKTISARLRKEAQ